jgi:hypothetical protein
LWGIRRRRAVRGDLGTLDLDVRIERLVREGHPVEQVKFELGAHPGLVGDAALAKIRDRPLRDRARVVVKGLLGIGAHGVAEEAERGMLAEGVDESGLDLRAGADVPALDASETGAGRAVVSHPLVEVALGEALGRDAHVHPLAGQTDDLEIDHRDLVLFDELQGFRNRGEHSVSPRR